MNFAGLLLGFATLFLIGIGFFWVIKLEYYVGAYVWKWVLSLGILFCLVSIWLPSFWASALLGILGGSLVWGATELPDQEKRVQKGAFPSNPKRANWEKIE
jgi:hypothetical protein